MSAPKPEATIPEGSPAVTSSPAYSVAEYCQWIQRDFKQMERQLEATKAELEELRGHHAKLQEQYHKNQKVLTTLEQQCRDKTDLNAHIIGVLIKVIDKLPKELQSNLKEQIERAKSTSFEDLQNSGRITPAKLGEMRRVESMHELRRVDSLKEGKKADELRRVQSTHEGKRMDEIRNLRVNSFQDLKKLDDRRNTNTPQPHQELRRVSSTAELASINAHFHEDRDENEGSWKKQKMSGTFSPMPLYSNSNDEDLELDLEEEGFQSKKRRSKTPTADRSTPLGRASSPTPSNLGIPKTAQFLGTLPHGEVVCATAFRNNSQVFTCGKGNVKLWDFKNISSQPLADLPALNDNYIRACKLLSETNTFIVGGETNLLSIWNLDGNLPQLKSNLNTPSPSCYSIAGGSQAPNVFFTGNGDGTVAMWDLREIQNGRQSLSFSGHSSEGVSCIDLSPDGTKLVSGGLDGTLRIWDIQAGKELASFPFPSPIFCLSICPGDSWIAVGLENSHIEVLNVMNSSSKYQLHLHDNCILSVKYSNSGKWFLSAGRDKHLNSWRSPFGGSLFRCAEPNSILCSDISEDDNYIVTGSGERLATIYEVIY